MARYAIGDIQGCYDEFMQLINKLAFNPSIDTLYLVGDLVNRGPQSLKVLQWIYRYQESIITVLGNHDIFLLGRYANVINVAADETISDILNSNEASKLIDFLRTCPLVFHDDKYFLVHAGIYPKLGLDQLENLNASVMHYLNSSDYGEFIKLIYGNKPNQWSTDLSLLKQMKFFINSCTRMRFLHKTTLALDYKNTTTIANCSVDLVPWFELEPHQSLQPYCVLFGHWAALGLMQTKNYVCLDTGCVWGKSLTALNLDTRELISVPAQLH